jgi:hypothetical protein
MNRVPKSNKKFNLDSTLLSLPFDTMVRVNLKGDSEHRYENSTQQMCKRNLTPVVLVTFQLPVLFPSLFKP